MMAAEQKKMFATPEETTSHILDLLSTYGEGDYIGEPISQLQHCLQAASLASFANASSETVLAALLHDIGQFLPPEELKATIQEMRPASTGGSRGSEDTDGRRPHNSGSVGRTGHDALGATYLRSHGFSEKVCALVGSHVDAKRYLCAIDPTYHDKVLSDASKESLKMQGGPMSSAEVSRWEASPWAADMANLRRWDDAAKVVGLQVLPTERYRSLMEEHLRAQD